MDNDCNVSMLKVFQCSKSVISPTSSTGAFWGNWCRIWSYKYCFQICSVYFYHFCGKMRKAHLRKFYISHPKNVFLMRPSFTVPFDEIGSDCYNIMFICFFCNSMKPTSHDRSSVFRIFLPFPSYTLIVNKS